MDSNRKALVTILTTLLLGVMVAAAGSLGGAAVGGIPVFAFAVALAFLIQWVAFIPAFAAQTERFFDLTGSLSYVLVTVSAFGLSPVRDSRSALLLVLVIAWAARLGAFLFMRVRKAGKDDRFDEIKPSFFRFLSVWTLQGLWVSLTLAAALAAITSDGLAPGSAAPPLRGELDAFALLGLLVWFAGFSIEAIADYQKSRFRADRRNSGAFIRTGLWAWSRHPNYFGEIVLWSGVALIAFPALGGWQYITLVSPLFVFVLLTRVSGIPLLETKADDRWGGTPEYEKYKAETPVLAPRRPRS